MSVNRRQFLLGSAGAAAAAALTGCDAPEMKLDLGLSALLPPGEIDPGPYEAPQSESVDLVSHVLNRLTFGPRPGDYARVAAMGVDAFIEEQLAPETIEDIHSDRAVRRYESIAAPRGELFEYQDYFLLRQMTQAVIARATFSRRQLFETMVEFWTDHLNIASSKGDCKWLKAADDRDVVRKHALGNFRELVGASAKSAAMLWYLDGRENRKANEKGSRPNENYARELLELHTLGVHGGYTQLDVMEVARCLTGWTVRSSEPMRKGEVWFNPDFHDDGPKIVLGRAIPPGQGEGDLESVIDIVASHSATARHIASKLCARFIDDSPPVSAVDAVDAAFRDSNGDIKASLRALFATDAFRETRANKFKRPFHFVVSALRGMGATTDIAESLTNYLERMGQSPFQYPTPDGYPAEAGSWMGTVMWRWHFARALASNRIAGTRIEREKWAKAFGDMEGLGAHLLGRTPDVEERTALNSPRAGLALILASPGFQRC